MIVSSGAHTFATLFKFLYARLMRNYLLNRDSYLRRQCLLDTTGKVATESFDNSRFPSVSASWIGDKSHRGSRSIADESDSIIFTIGIVSPWSVSNIQYVRHKNLTSCSNVQFLLFVRALMKSILIIDILMAAPATSKNKLLNSPKKTVQVRLYTDGQLDFSI